MLRYFCMEMHWIDVLFIATVTIPVALGSLKHLLRLRKKSPGGRASLHWRRESNTEFSCTVDRGTLLFLLVYFTKSNTPTSISDQS